MTQVGSSGAHLPRAHHSSRAYSSSGSKRVSVGATKSSMHSTSAAESIAMSEEDDKVEDEDDE